MKRLIEQTACEHDKWEPHDFETYSESVPGIIGVNPHLCPGGSSREVVVDYEAALSERLKLRWAEDGMGPYAEELADKVLPNGVKVPVISDFEETKRIVDAALGGGR